MTVKEAITNYETKKNLVEQNNKEYDEQVSAYRIVLDVTIKDIENKIREELEVKDNVRIDIDCYSSETHRIRIENIKNENTSLAWDISINYRSGSPVIESNSWSGMNITTLENIEEVESFIPLWKRIISFDWSKYITVNMPDYFDYVTIEKMSADYSKEIEAIKEAQISEIIGINKAIKVTEHKSWGDNVAYYVITKETPKAYNVYYQYNGELTATERDYHEKFSKRITKEKFFAEYLTKNNNRIYEIIEF